MSEHAVLGPVDPQLGKYPAASVLKVIKRNPVAEIDDETLICRTSGEGDRSVASIVQELLEGKPTNGTGPDELARILSLSEGTWMHDYPITHERARALGLQVRSDIPDDVLKLMSLYPQPTRTQPSVELPVPRTRRSAGDAPSATPG